MITAPILNQPAQRPAWIPIIAAAFASFTTYFCMYGFRKPITAATFEGQMIFGISLKSAVIITQVLGYMSSKFLGIKFISELDKSKRSGYILLLLGLALFSLLFFAITPKPFNIIFIFTNGLCLGLIWGLVFSFLEGRKYTDLLALILSTNFIFSSGVAKTIGLICINRWGIPEMFMPFFAGILYLPLLFLSVWMLQNIPPPTSQEIESRGNRIPLDKKARISLLGNFLVGIAAITVLNLVLTILRDIKDNFAVEMLTRLKPDFNPSIFTKMETIAAFSVLALLLLLTGIKNHFKSLLVHHVTIAVGLLVVVSATYLLKQHVFDPVMILVFYTIGLYVCYNTLQCLFLERFIASFKVAGNIGFLFYFMDAIGYLGSCFIIFNKEIFNRNMNWLNYFLQISFVLGGIGMASILVSWFYFKKKHR